MADDVVGRAVKVLVGPWRNKRGLLIDVGKALTPEGNKLTYYRVRLDETGIYLVFLPGEVYVGAMTDKVASGSGKQ